MTFRVRDLAATTALALFCTPLLADDARSNALQDCWTSQVNIELESYQFTSRDNMSFNWSHRIENECSNYTARILLFECANGLSKPGAIVASFEVDQGLVVPHTELAHPDLLSLHRSWTDRTGPLRLARDHRMRRQRQRRRASPRRRRRRPLRSQPRDASGQPTRTGRVRPQPTKRHRRRPRRRPRRP